MNHYASYIWSAYGIVGGVLLFNLAHAKWRQLRIRKHLQQWFKRV